MKRLFVTLLLAFAGATHAADDAALRAVEACRARLDAKVDVGIARIQRRCPDLLPALQSAPWRDLLPRSMSERREELSAESLRALAELVRQANAVQPRRAPPDAAELAKSLAALGEEGRQGETRWERFKRWLKERMEKRKDDGPGLLEEWTRNLHTSEGVARLITYAGYGLVVALVLFVVFAELRAAGLLGRRRQADAGAHPNAEWRRRLTLADVNSAPLAERPGMMLRLLGEALTRAHRLPAADGLTAGAIARRAALESEADRAALAQVARTSEMASYGPRTPPADELENTVSGARELLAKFARLAAPKRAGGKS